MLARKRITIIGASLMLIAGQCGSGLSQPTSTESRAQVDVAFERLLADPRLASALSDLQADDTRTFDERKHIATIPAPPYKEAARAVARSSARSKWNRDRRRDHVRRNGWEE